MTGPTQPTSPHEIQEANEQFLKEMTPPTKREKILRIYEESWKSMQQIDAEPTWWYDL